MNKKQTRPNHLRVVTHVKCRPLNQQEAWSQCQAVQKQLIGRMDRGFMFPQGTFSCASFQNIHAHELNPLHRGTCSPGPVGSPSCSLCGDTLASCQLSRRAAGEQHLTAKRQLCRPHFQRLREREKRERLPNLQSLPVGWRGRCVGCRQV